MVSTAVNGAAGVSRSDDQSESASNTLWGEQNTKIASASSGIGLERYHSQRSSNDAESTRLDTKTRWAFPDEVQQAEHELHDTGALGAFPNQYSNVFTFSTVRDLDVPSPIMK